MGPRAKDDRLGFGHWCESVAARYLAARGHQVLERNWRCTGGEIDLVTQDGDSLVVVEVRAKRGEAMGSPEESLTSAKQSRLISLADAYVQAQGWQGTWRIDVVAVVADRRGRLLRVDHYESAIPG